MIKKVYSLDKALKLRNMGNYWLYTEPNHKLAYYKVCVGEDTEK